MSEFWEKRYSEKEFAYGKEPNKYFKSKLEKLSPGKMLLVGEGEGRNAAYAASRGWSVDAVDFSAAAKEKALLLARETGVEINYTITDFNEFVPPVETYDAIGIIYIHLEEELRMRLFSNLVNSLKPGGKIILEGFEKEQAKNSSGGPRNPDLLYSLEDIVDDFQDLEFEQFSKETIVLNEGGYHNGEAIVIRFLGQKPII